MVTQVNVQEAKTHLSALLARAEAGEEIVIARSGKAVVRLALVDESPSRSFGIMDLALPDSFFEPLPPSTLDSWE